MHKRRTKQAPQEDVFLDIIDELRYKTDEELRQVAEDAGCHWVTLYSWMAGNVTAPQVRTLFPVARALGYEITLVARKKKKAKLYRIK